MRPRLIPLLLFDNAHRLVKTVGFGRRTYIGDPFNVVRILNEKEVDEICILDIDATVEGRKPDAGFIAELASECFMPFAYGGGLSDLATCETLNRAGVEKFVVSSAARTPGLLRELAATLGSQAVVGCVDVRGGLDGHCTVRSATQALAMSPVDYARQLEDCGAGELLLQSVDGDGSRAGLDLRLIAGVAAGVGIPVIGAGGAGDVGDLIAGLRSGASAVASGSAFSFVGRLRAVLVTYPDAATIAAAQTA